MSKRPDSTVGQGPLPIQPVDRPILCSPYEEPSEHWVYDTQTGEAQPMPGRRPASYWFKTQRVATQQLGLFAEEEREDLPLVNALRQDVKRWRQSGYEGATQVTKELLRYWWRTDRPRRLFFCQLEAAETVIFLNEIRLSGKRLRFKPAFQDEYLAQLQDVPADPALPPLTRLGLKMATGSGKTVVMAQLIAWAFCNRGKVPSDERFPSTTLIVCPNLTIKDRLQVLRQHPDNYYAAFDLVPNAYRPLMQAGKILVTNWHLFAPESEHAEGGQSYLVVNKGEESPAAFARRVLGDLAPIMVFNDEAHHAWRPRPAEQASEIGQAFEASRLSSEELVELEEATVWINGLDMLNQAVGIRACVDLSATPFYLYGSGYVEGSPFPWLVSDFGLVDAIESGIVKIPRLPVSDTTGRPEPRYFHLWKSITENLRSGERLPGRARKPKPEVIYREAEFALRTLAGQWVERFQYIQAATDEQDKTPPVLIIVCDNTDLAEVFYRHISGEQVIEADESGEGDEGDEEAEAPPRKRGPKPKTRVVYGQGRIFPAYFSNRAGFTPTVRIDSKLLAQAESGEPGASRQDAADQLRRLVATVGKKGEPGEQVRCIVSVAMLNEGWDANNVTHILGVRAFGSQLLCEQVVGRGLRRMDYTPDPKTGLLTEEYVDIYGVPFTLIPFKGRQTKVTAPEDKPKNHVRALPERADYEMRFPVVEGYAFALRRNVITADIDAMEPLRLEPETEPTAVFVKPRVGYQVGLPTLTGPGDFEEQNRQAYYASTHLQTIEFEIALRVVTALVNLQQPQPGRSGGSPLPLQSRHQLFPYKPIGTAAEVDFKTVRPCYSTVHSHINLVAADSGWEQTAAAQLEQAAQRGIIQCYARNAQLGLTIPYEFLGESHHYEPDFLVRLSNDGGDTQFTLLLEIKGMEDEQDRAKHEAARRWVEAVNNWGQLGRWGFSICRDPLELQVQIINQRRISK